MQIFYRDTVHNSFWDLLGRHQKLGKIIYLYKVKTGGGGLDFWSPKDRNLFALPMTGRNYF